MPYPFTKISHGYAAQSLHQAGLTLSQLPKAMKIALETGELWLQKELENGNVKQALQVLKGQMQDKGPRLLLNRLQDMVLIRLMVHLGIKGVLASNIVTLLFPFVLKKVYKMAMKNSAVQTRWHRMGLNKGLSSLDKIKCTIRDMGHKLSPDLYRSSCDPT